MVRGEGSQGQKWNPWQPIWGNGLDTLGKKGRANKKPEDVYVVCWTDNDGKGFGGMKDPFNQKLHQPNVENWLGSGQTKWVYDDFDPKYGLVRVGSHGTIGLLVQASQFLIISCPSLQLFLICNKSI